MLGGEETCQSLNRRFIIAPNVIVIGSVQIATQRIFVGRPQLLRWSTCSGVRRAWLVMFTMKMIRLRGGKRTEWGDQNEVQNHNKWQNISGAEAMVLGFLA
jgi:hypothetical protein